MSDILTKKAPPARASRRRRPLRKIDAAMRARIETAITTMIEALDALDVVDEDREDGDDGGEEGGSSDDEPTLGYADFEARYGRYPDIPVDDGEPSLGWTPQEAARGRYAVTADREDEHDGREPDVDDEPGGDDEPRQRS